MKKDELEKLITEYKPQYIYQRYNGRLTRFEVVKDNYLVDTDTGMSFDFKSHMMLGKLSNDLIDLIEYGDLVKFKAGGIDVIDMRTNEKINLIFPDAEFCNGWTDDCMIYDLDYLIEKDQSEKIDWVLTHEQIKENCIKNDK